MDETQAQIVAAIRTARQQIRWKPGKAQQHLLKRIRLGHLPTDATLEDYHRIIQQVLTASDAEVYLFTYANALYPTVVVTISRQVWLVMLDLSGWMETAFVVEEPQIYFTDLPYTHLGALKELDR